MSDKKKKGTVLWEGIPEMMANRAIRENSLRRVYPDGRQTVFLNNGDEISFEEFDKKFPLSLIYKEPKGANVCKKSDFLYK